MGMADQPRRMATAHSNRKKRPPAATNHGHNSDSDGWGAAAPDAATSANARGWILVLLPRPPCTTASRPGVSQSTALAIKSGNAARWGRLDLLGSKANMTARWS